MILWWEMRTGKTRSALHAYNQLLNRGEVCDLVFVTVATAMATIKQEVEEMGLGVPVYLCRGKTRQYTIPEKVHDTPRIYILNWEILPQWQRYFHRELYVGKRPFCLVADEGHLYLRNPNNQRYKAIQWLARFAYRYWELTGTLMAKGGMDLYYQLKLLGGKSNPYQWMDAEDFGKQFCNRQFNPFKGYKGGWDYVNLKNEQALVARLPAVSVLRMDDVADVPLPVQLPRWVADYGGAWRHGRSDQTLAEEIAGMVEDKARLTIEYVKSLEERPVVVFGWNVRFTQLVAEGLNAPRIYGGTSIEGRDRVRRDFQAGRVPVLVGNLRSLGLGVSLDRADHFVYGEPYWDAALYLQAQARGRSLYKQRPLTHHHLLVAGSPDEYIWKVRLDRGRAIERLYDAAAEAKVQPDEEAM
jgi:hypothetical protein